MERYTKKRRKKNKKKKTKVMLCFLLLILVGLVIVLPWASKPENLGGLIDKFVEIFQGNEFKDSYNGKSLVLTDLSNDDNYIYKQAEEQ